MTAYVARGGYVDLIGKALVLFPRETIAAQRAGMMNDATDQGRQTKSGWHFHCFAVQERYKPPKEGKGHSERGKETPTEIGTADHFYTNGTAASFQHQAPAESSLNCMGDGAVLENTRSTVFECHPVSRS